MLRSFDEAEGALLSSGRKCGVALCGAENANSLEALIQAKNRGVAEGILLGSRDKICAVLKEAGRPLRIFDLRSPQH